MSIFSRVCDSKAEDPFNCALFKCYKFMKGRTGSMLSRTKYVKCFRVETICYRLVPQAAQTHVTREGCNVIYIPQVTRRCRVTGDC